LNFKYFSYLTLSFTLFSCGIKAPPTPPPGTKVPSYQSKFLEVSTEKDQEKKTQKLK